MTKASKTTYLIGRIFGIVMTILCLVSIAIGIFYLRYVIEIRIGGKLAYDNNDINHMGKIFLILGIVLFVTTVISLITSAIAKKSIDNGKNRALKNILAISFALTSANVFSLLGGVFAICIKSEAEGDNAQE